MIAVIGRDCYLKHICSFFTSALDIFGNGLPLLLADDGTHVDDLVEAVSDPEVRESRLQLFDELIENRFLDEKL